MDFSGLSAFPPTPFSGDAPDVAAFARVVGRVAAAGVDSIGALGSTGHYAYLGVQQRIELTRAAVEAAEGTPVLVSIGALATRDVVELAHGVQEAGASGVLLAPVSYQPLLRDEVLGLYTDAVAELSIPLCVYDNPRVTGFEFDDEFYAQIAQLPHVASIKIPGVPLGPGEAEERLRHLRAALPGTVTIGVSGDQSAVTGLQAGADVWYSVIAGVLPEQALRLTVATLAEDADEAQRLEAQLAGFWPLFARLGSVRVVAEVALQLGLGEGFLPRPLRRIPGPDREAVSRWLREAQSTP